MFGRDKWKEGDYLFSYRKDNSGEYNDIIVGVVTGVEGAKLGVNGIIVNPVGLKNKVSQGKAGEKSHEVLKNPTPENCIFSLIYRVETENFTDVLDTNTDSVTKIGKKMFSVLDGWVRESIPELINNVLSLPEGQERDQAKTVLRKRMETLYDKDLKQNLYSVCRSLQILT